MIKQDKNNARIHGEKNKNLIRKSIQELGAGRSIVIDNEDFVIAGNGVFEQAEKLGLKTKIIESDGSELIVIKRTDLNYDDEKRRLLAIADNATADTSEWNFEILTAAEIEEWEIDFEEEVEELTASEDDFEHGDVDGIETDIILGDLFEIGEHRLLCGDSTDSDQVAKLMGGDVAELLLIDPPYNINFKSQRTGKGYDKHDDNLSEKEYLNLNKEIHNNSLLFTKKSIITCGKQNLKMWIENFDITDIAIWIAKNKMSGGKISNLSLWEPILFIGKFDRNDRPTDLFEYSTKLQKDADEHPCPKVIEFFAEIIKSYTNKSVLDLFLGSGTTMVASHQLKRKCYGMELDPKYCNVIIKRMIKLDDSLIIKRNGVDETSKWLEM